jgi:hypothetical protein
MPINRRVMIKGVSVYALLFSMGAAWAAQPVVEIIAFARPCSRH